jgi:GNAT superfamily N-acetyltransferase
VTVTVRQLQAHELKWANGRYGEIDFLPSTQDDYIAVAENDGQPAGLGRLVRVGGEACELGGMYVFPEQRGGGISRAIIGHLIAAAGRATLYCLPFGNLRGLYESFGFREQAPDPAMPDQVLEKFKWCNSHYGREVLLLVLNPEAGDV